MPSLYPNRKLKTTLGNIIFLVIYRYLGDQLTFLFYGVKFSWSFSLHHYIESILSVLIVLELTSLLSEVIKKRANWARNTTFHFLLKVVLSIPLCAMVSPVIAILSSVIRNDLQAIQGMELPFAMLNNWGLTIVILAYDLVVHLLSQWRRSILEVERFKKESIEFRFETLKNQVNPHFLFNSLNTLSSLMHLDIDAAEKYLRQLAKVYRYVLENKEIEVINLETELNILQSYIYLVQMRFKDKLNIKIDISDDLASFGIAPMTLQLLIENAIKHNEVSRKFPLIIDISSQDHDYLTVKNIIQLKTSKEYSTKVGLNNIIKRYQYLTDKPVTVDDSSGVFRVGIPLLAITEDRQTSLHYESTDN